jgi:type I restriction enzyme M protein
MARKQKTAAQPLTTAQRLSSIVKSCRDIMRKDKGLNGDLDRLPMLTWIMFLKFLDDMEDIREQEAKMAGKRFRHAIEPPYRWRDWAMKEAGITGDELIAFVNNEARRGTGGAAGLQTEASRRYGRTLALCEDLPCRACHAPVS